MSRKNHQVVNCRLLQTDKPFSQLKQTQKEKINEWLYQEYRAVYQKVGISASIFLFLACREEIFSQFFAHSSLSLTTLGFIRIPPHKCRKAPAQRQMLFVDLSISAVPDRIPAALHQWIRPTVCRTCRHLHRLPVFHRRSPCAVCFHSAPKALWHR